MNHGFYSELDKLRLEDPHADFSFLEQIKVTDDRDAHQFLHGFCDDFAAALSEVFGYEIESVRHWEVPGLTGSLIHVYCIAELHGEIAYIDIRGITTDAELFFEEFENEVTYDPRNDELFDLEGPAVVEFWDCKDALFEGRYQGWSNEQIKAFILENEPFFNVALLERGTCLDQKIRLASSQVTQPFPTTEAKTSDLQRQSTLTHLDGRII